MVEYYVQWVVTEFMRDSFASVHATVFDCLVGMPGAMVSVKEICVYGDEGEMGGNVRTFMIRYAIQVGVRSTHLSHVYVYGMCNSLYGIIILFRSMVFRA